MNGEQLIVSVIIYTGALNFSIVWYVTGDMH